jgi:hypothetical protein
MQRFSGEASCEMATWMSKIEGGYGYDGNRF